MLPFKLQNLYIHVSSLYIFNMSIFKLSINAFRPVAHEMKIFEGFGYINLHKNMTP